MSMDKSEARKAAFGRRKGAFGQGLDAAAQAHLREALAGCEGKPLAGYMPIRTEIDPVPVMAGWAAPVGVPVIQGKGQALKFHRWQPDWRYFSKLCIHLSRLLGGLNVILHLPF